MCVAILFNRRFFVRCKNHEHTVERLVRELISSTAATSMLKSRTHGRTTVRQSILLVTVANNLFAKSSKWRWCGIWCGFEDNAVGDSRVCQGAINPSGDKTRCHVKSTRIHQHVDDVKPMWHLMYLWVTCCVNMQYCMWTCIQCNIACVGMQTLHVLCR